MPGSLMPGSLMPGSLMPGSLMQSFPLEASLEPVQPAFSIATAEPVQPAFSIATAEPVQLAFSVATAEPTNVAPMPVPVVPSLPAEAVPLPVPRPAESRLSERRGRSPSYSRRFAQQSTGPAVPTAPTDIRAFFEKLFGVQKPSGPVLAYAAPQGGLADDLPGLTSKATPGYDRWTAVYDLSARTVYLPNGKRLEAHSGLGNRMDDPRYVHERMRGATPPNVYALRPREQLFHGVRALRLIPIGNGDLYGRTGLLAHTYMLGPNGDSNGCVSFRNYDAFLQAYHNGEIKRLVVVASLN
jgi:hypothetical protein